MEDEGESRLHALDEFEVADDALCPHLLGRQLALAVGELERVGGVGEALAAEDGRTLAAEELRACARVLPRRSSAAWTA